MTTIETIGGFVLVIVLIFSMIVIYNNFFDQTEVDIAGFAACAARGVQAGGRGECSVDAACSGISVKSGEYASYLGVQCTGKEPGVEPNPSVPEKKYCCVIIPRYANPPAGTLAEGQIENNRNYCESTSPLVTGKAVGVITPQMLSTARGQFCYLTGESLLRSDTGLVKIRYFPTGTSGTVYAIPTIHYTLPGSAQSQQFGMSALTAPVSSTFVEFTIDIGAQLRAQPNIHQSLSGISGDVSINYFQTGVPGGILVIPFTIP